MIRINLLGADSAKKSKGLRAIRLPEFSVGAVQAGIAGMFVVVLLGIGFARWSQSGTLKRMRTELALVQSERARVQEVADQVDALQDRTDLLRQKLEVIVELKANQTGPVMLLDEISRLVTDGLWLTNSILPAVTSRSAERLCRTTLWPTFSPTSRPRGISSKCACARWVTPARQ